jgi:hypothetical protein
MEMCSGNADESCRECAERELCWAGFAQEVVKPATVDAYLAKRADELLQQILKCYAGAYTAQGYRQAEAAVLPNAGLNSTVVYRKRVVAARCK